MLSYSPLLISLHNRLRDTKKPLFPSPPRNPLTGGGAVASSSKIMYDVSNIREVSDHQEVFVDPSRDESLIFEILELKEEVGDDGSASWFLQDLASEQESEGCVIVYGFILKGLSNLFHINREVVAELKAAGATWIQFDEPTLVKDLDSHQLQAFTRAYSELESSLSGLNVIIESYFADVPAEAYKTLTSLKGVAGYGFDLVNETKLDAEIKSWLAFAAQKVVEVNALAKALSGHKDEAFFAANAAAQASRKSSPRVTNEHVQKSAAALKGSDLRRATNVSVRLDAQQKKLSLPVLPTTTIGSFPQTMDLRRVRREYKAKKISEENYVSAIKEEINKVIKLQEELDIDRNDMVEYFGEQLSGFAFTVNGWVQSYGSCCVKPPIIYGDVSRPKAMTVFWSSLAQSLTKRPMKGMLTGPVTILNWSFVRNDQPRSVTCYQIALAIKDEVEDLEKAVVCMTSTHQGSHLQKKSLTGSIRCLLSWRLTFYLVDDGRTFQSSGTIKERENEREIWGFGVLEHWQNRAIMLSYSPLLISLHNRLRDTKKPLFPSPPRNPLTGGGAVASSSKIIIQRYFYSRNSQLLNIDDMCTNFLHNIWHLGLDTVPVLVGPVSYLLLSKPAKGVEKSFSLLSLIGNILSVYKEVVAELKAAGATWIQFDEPTLVKDLDSHQLQAFTHAYSELESSLSGLNVIIESYFADVPAEAYKTLTSLKGVAGYGFDLVCGTKTLDLIKSGFPSGKYLFAGVVDGRNIWANDLASSISTLEALEGIVGKDKVVVSTSCSLLHTAVDLVNETKLDAEIKSWLAFAAQKVVEVNALAKVLSGHKDEAFFAANAAAQASRKSSTRVTNEHVQKSAAALKGSDHRRATNVSVRLDAQQKKLSLPVLPTTTIGSFPQTMDLRRVRREYKAKKISEENYVSAIKEEINKVVKLQEELDIDRNDMFEYFGEQLSGFAFTVNGWVQSYGSRCVKPPIIYGDVSRPKAMTVF
ncbi:hypothetical protein G4B88_011721 [Cannabis sativa]|uniref:5-methyltetrahydropteroyltriglutamate--homocysteine S-methyltransferase n=1 Tax=Cannabis sativa TaxID=3483 RepID=A0A7J6DKC7_CANSA|nr:hypothetical protein G4B88_011721 [Cannabis sativa]